MLQFASGIKLPFPEKLKEEFQVFPQFISFHISLEKILPMVDAFLDQMEEPLFFVLQLPLNEEEEIEARKKENSQMLHQKVCYLDGQSKAQVRSLLQQYGELFLQDGLSQFAVGSHVTPDEIFIQKYKLVNIYSSELTKYFDFLHKYGLTQTDNLVTAWDTFSRETPGEARLIKIDGMDVFDVYEKLVELGMYDAKIIEC